MSRTLLGLIIDRHDANGEMLRRFLDQPEFASVFTTWARGETFRQIRGQAEGARVAAQRRRGCVFCGDADLTREHVYGKWLRPYYGPASQVLSIVQSPDGDTRRRPQVPFDITVRCVCRGCNNGWMSRLEGKARTHLVPLMQGAVTQLQPEALATISAWTFKTVLMIQEQAGLAIPLVPRAEAYLHLMREGSAPPGVRVWLSEHGATLTDATAVAFSTLDRIVVTGGADPALPVGSPCYSAGIALGRLVLIVLGSVSGADVPESVDMAPWLRVAWPDARPTWWPPSRSADEFGGFWPFYGRLFPEAGG